MPHLYQHIAARVRVWSDAGYPSEQYPAIAEVLDWARDTESGELRFLRRPQLEALETYWYLRLVEETPHVLDLYRRLLSRPSELLAALGLDHGDIQTLVVDEGIDALLDRIRSDDALVRDFRLEALRETLTLQYPSYILALAMGAGKTMLIGAIIATEFAMALEYPDGPFVQNALVFAPGKTIIESLRELAEVPYDRLLPPRLFRPFSASVKLTFTRDGEKDVPVIRGSAFNVVVTNTEKIRIKKESVRKADLGTLFAPQKEDEARAEIANLRLQAIASLPHLAVFSDEAHHTYGQSLDTELKKVRKTVDYLAASTHLVCVVNTTGTPYFKRQPLKDVVVWYGLSEGIRDGILKDLSDSVQAYDFQGNAATYVAHVVRDFFRDYGEVRLPNGAPAKLAVYFPQTNDLRELRPVIDQALVEAGRDPALCLVNTSDQTLTRQADIDAFNRLNDPTAPHRVLLLVNKGTEGWNCPSLFACALARRLKTSNNFVLQAATRCLRQVPGNTHKARVYLSTDNFNILDRQLQETYGETIADLSHTAQESRRTRIVLRKLGVPPLSVTHLARTVVRKEGEAQPLRLVRPRGGAAPGLTRTTYTLEESPASARVLRQLGDTVNIDALPEATDAYGAAVDLAARYRLDLWQVLGEIRRLYGADDIPASDLPDLAGQIERQTRFYEVTEERQETALALVKPEGFVKERDAQGAEVYTAEIRYPKDKEALLARFGDWKVRAGELGFHYDPYNFDSRPERDFFDKMLAELSRRLDDVEDIYFTGALTDPAKTDFFVQYRDDEGRWRRYTPDFVIRLKPEEGGKPGTGKTIIVEIKAERQRRHPVDGEHGRKAMALRRWENLDPRRLRYEMVFTDTDAIPRDGLTAVRRHLP